MGMFCADCFSSYFLLLYYAGLAAQPVPGYPRKDFWNNVFSLQWVLVFWMQSSWFYKCAVSLWIARSLNDKHSVARLGNLDCYCLGNVDCVVCQWNCNNHSTICLFFGFLLIADNIMRKFHSQRPSWMCPPLLFWFCVTLFVCTYL